MSRKWFIRWILVPVLAGVVVFGRMPTALALAQEDPPPKDSSCIDCHQEQYFIFDSGKSYCLNETRVSCTGCHGGLAGTMVENLAHEDLVANPLEDNAAICQDCHPDDYQAKVEQFASIAGVSSTPRPCPTCTPSAVLVSQPPDSAGGPLLLRTLPSGVWQAVGLGFLGIAFLVVFLFTCRCWQIDRLCRIKEQQGG